MAVLAVLHYRPEGTLAGIVVFAGGYVVARLLVGFFWAISPVFLREIIPGV
jgi:hypothetical protein